MNCVAKGARGSRIVVLTSYPLVVLCSGAAVVLLEQEPHPVRTEFSWVGAAEQFFKFNCPGVRAGKCVGRALAPSDTFLGPRRARLLTLRFYFLLVLTTVECFFSSLDLTHNSLNGTVPLIFTTLKSMASLSLGYNAFTGTIPSEYGNITTLTYLDLSSQSNGVSLTGTIPPTLSSLVSLR